MIEIIAVVFSLLSVVLSIKNNILTWPVGIVGIIFYTILFYQNEIWGNMNLQFLFILQSIHGWYNWNKPNKYQISWYENNRNLISSTILLTIFVTIILLSINDKSPFFDGITTSLSVIGIILLSFRKIETWIYWIIADSIFVWFFITENLYLSALVYFIFLILAILGLKEWKKIIKTV